MAKLEETSNSLFVVFNDEKGVLHAVGQVDKELARQTILRYVMESGLNTHGVEFVARHVWAKNEEEALSLAGTMEKEDPDTRSFTLQ